MKNPSTPEIEPERPKLARVFAPQSVALVGASKRSAALGAWVLANLSNGGFAGSIYPVNPKYTRLGRRACYPSVTALPRAVDLAIVSIPAPYVAGVIEDCGRARIAGAVVLSAGFGEMGAEGKEREQALLATAAKSGVRLVGPNCLGILRPPIGLNASFAQSSSAQGRVALLSQSGALCTAMIDVANGEGFGFSSVISLGAAIDIDFGDALEFLLADPETEAILLYVEGIRHARPFLSALAAASRSKPVVVLKAGTNQDGSRAVASHTGALLGDDSVFSAAVEQCGALRVATMAEFVDVARMLANGVKLKGKRIAIATNGGGPAVLAADRVHARELTLARLAVASCDTLRQFLPPQATINNPIDVLGDAGPERLAKALTTIASDPNVDAVITIFCPQRAMTGRQAARVVIQTSRDDKTPLVPVWLGEESVDDARKLCNNADLVNFQHPEAAVDSLAHLAELSHVRSYVLGLETFGTPASEATIANARALVQAALNRGETRLTEQDAKTLVAAFGIPIPPMRLAKTAEEAMQAANEIGYPVVLKLISPDVLHKSDIGGVVLDVRDEHQVRATFDVIMAATAQRAPGARVDGVLVQAMVRERSARELIVGLAVDTAFGTVLSFGAGGVAVEKLRDTAVALPPLSNESAGRLVSKTRIARLLTAYRDIPAANEPALRAVLHAVSQIAVHLPEVSELDINPLLLGPTSAIALDCRVILDPARKPSTQYRHLAVHPYPRELVGTITVKGGRTFPVRPIHQRDAGREAAFVKALSPQTLYMRFFTATRELPPEALIRFVRIDYEREMALVVLDTEGDEAAIIAVARYVRSLDDTVCEFAIVVADAWQNQGIGYALLTRLIEVARSRGFVEMHGDILANNTGMRALMQHLGFKDVATEDAATVRVRLPLTMPAEDRR